MGERGDEELDRHVFYGLVGEFVPVVAAEGDGAAMKLGGGVAGIRDTGQDSGEREGGGVDGVLTGGDELVTDGLATAR